MKKILFSAYSLDLGGIETALITLLKELSKHYDITLVLEKKEGLFFDELPSSIKVIEYKPNNHKLIILRKFMNLINRLEFYIKYHNKYYFSCSFATYSRSGSYCARVASKNNALWVHNDYLTMYKGNKHEYYAFFNSIEHSHFKTISFVSNEARVNYQKMYPNTKSKLITCNNLINYKNILKKSEEDIDIEENNVTTFLNVGRHDEHQKRLSRLLEAAKKLKEKGYQFKIIMLGSGPDTNRYEKLIKKYKLENHIDMLGSKKNPYPYFKECDAVILTSDYEGYPVVFVESLVLKKPILTTAVSDAKEDIEGKFGIIMQKDSNDIANCMATFIEKNYQINTEFNPKLFNENIVDKLTKIIENNN